MQIPASAEIRTDVFGVRVGGAIVWSNLLPQRSRDSVPSELRACSTSCLETLRRHAMKFDAMYKHHRP